MMEKDENSQTSYRYISDTFFIVSISKTADSFYILKRCTVSVNVMICPRIVESWRMRFMRQLRQETRGVSAQTITVSKPKYIRDVRQRAFSQTNHQCKCLFSSQKSLDCCSLSQLLRSSLLSCDHSKQLLWSQQRPLGVQQQLLHLQ